MQFLSRLVKAVLYREPQNERTKTVDGHVWTRQRGKWITTEVQHDTNGRVIAVTLRTRTADHPSMREVVRDDAREVKRT